WRTLAHKSLDNSATRANHGRRISHPPMGRMPSGARIMGWRLCNIGFGVLLGPAVTHPTLRRRLLTAVDERRTGQEVLLAGDGRHHALRHEVEELPARSQPSVGQMALEY